MIESIPTQPPADVSPEDTTTTTTTIAPPPVEPITATLEVEQPVESTEHAAVANTTPAVDAAPIPEETEPIQKDEPVATPTPAETAPVEAASSPLPIAPEEPSTTTENVDAPAATVTLPIISSGPSWPAVGESHPLAIFQSRLPELLKAADHKHIWGITLSTEQPIPFHTTLVLQKFLRANSNDVEAAYNQLLGTLKWRKEYNPEAACDEEFSEVKFGGLGYVVKTKTKDGEKIVTYNIYGACKDAKKTFGNLERFVQAISSIL